MTISTAQNHRAPKMENIQRGSSVLGCLSTSLGEGTHETRNKRNLSIECQAIHRE